MVYTNPRPDYKGLCRVFRLAGREQTCWLCFRIWKWGIMNAKALPALLSLPTLALARHKNCLRFFLPSLSPASFFFWHCSSLSVCFASIRTPLHLWDDGCVSSHTLTCRPSHLVLFVYLARALLTCTLNKKKKKHTNTLSSPLCVLCLMLSMIWRPSLYGRHPRGPHCICVTDNARKIQWRVHTHFYLMCAVYYSWIQSEKHWLNWQIQRHHVLHILCEYSELHVSLSPPQLWYEQLWRR